MTKKNKTLTLNKFVKSPSVILEAYCGSQYSDDSVVTIVNSDEELFSFALSEVEKMYPVNEPETLPEELLEAAKTNKTLKKIVNQYQADAKYDKETMLENKKILAKIGNNGEKAWNHIRTDGNEEFMFLCKIRGVTAA